MMLANYNHNFFHYLEGIHWKCSVFALEPSGVLLLPSVTTSAVVETDDPSQTAISTTTASAVPFPTITPSPSPSPLYVQINTVDPH